MRVVQFLGLLAACLVFAFPIRAQTHFTADDILRVSPRANPDLVKALVENQSLLYDEGINSRIRVAHFLAQVMTETGGLRRLDENMNYSADRLLEVFSRRVISVDKARELGGKPQEIANWVYGNRLGNRGRHTNDGWDYRGSGYIQLTGRDNFSRRGLAIGLPLAEQPEVARKPVEGLKAAVAYWSAVSINDAADLNDRYRVRVLVNGPAAHGYEASVLWFNTIWVKVMRDRPEFGDKSLWIEASEEALPADDRVAVGSILSDLGFLAGSAVEASDEGIETALRSYQESRDLQVTGVLDEDTFYAITDPEEWRSVEATEFAALPMVDPDSGAAMILDSGTLVEDTQVFEPNDAVQLADGGVIGTDEANELAAAIETYADYEAAKGTYEGPIFVPQTPIGEDERTAVMSTNSFPNSAVVQILFKKAPGAVGSNLCTGAMISPDMVLTAGHCVHSGTAMGSWYFDYRIFPGRNLLSKPFGSCKGVKIFALKGWTDASTNSDARYYDLGAIKLDCQVGEKTGWFGLRPMEDSEFGQVVTVQAYAGMKLPSGRQWISSGAIEVMEQLKAFYKNDTEGGSSGAPVFKADDPSVICVHTNGLHGSPPWNVANACTRLTPSRLATIADWMAQ